MVGSLTTSSDNGAKDALADPKGLGEGQWARVGKIQLIRREVREFLPASAVELLFAHAEHVVEGGMELGEGGVAHRAYATVMVTIDLARCADLFREPADEATAQRLAELMTEDRSVHDRLVTFARRELARISGLSTKRLRVSLEHQVRAEGCRLLLDGDAMVSLGAATQSSR